MLGVMDLLAFGAKYHNDCYVSLRDSMKASNIEKKILKVYNWMQQCNKYIHTYIETNDDCEFSI